MMLQDLETAVRLSLQIVFVIFCDQSLVLIEMVQARRGFPRYGVHFRQVEFASVADGFGARGMKLHSLEGLSEIVPGSLRSDRPTVIEVPIDGSEYVDQL